MHFLAEWSRPARGALPIGPCESLFDYGAAKGRLLVGAPSREIRGLPSAIVRYSSPHGQESHIPSPLATDGSAGADSAVQSLDRSPRQAAHRLGDLLPANGAEFCAYPDGGDAGTWGEAQKAPSAEAVTVPQERIRTDVNFAWPTAEIVVMGPEGAVSIVYRRPGVRSAAMRLR